MRQGQRIALLGVVLSAALALLKILTGVFSGSSALLADGFESSGDVLSSGVVWLGLMVAAKPADSNHPYGHGRAETLSGLFVGMLLLFAGMAILAAALLTASRVHSVPAPYAIWPLFISIAAKLWIFRLKWVTSRRIGSSALAADATNDAVDVFSALMALAALSLTLCDPDHFLRADRYGAAVVGFIMVVTGIRVARRSGRDLMDTMPEAAFVERIREIARELPGVDGVEKVYARKTGLSHHVDLHLEVDPAMTVRLSHELAHRVEDRLLERMRNVADVLIHIEPSRDRRGQAAASLAKASSLEKLPDATLNVEDARPVPDPGGVVRMFFEGRTDMLRSITAGRFVLSPGTSPHPPHQHPEEEFMLVVEGTGEVLCDAQTKRVGPGAMMYCAGHKLHGITNTGVTPMTFYFYKWLA